MSLDINTAFLERVASFIDDTDGMSYIPKHAEQLLANQDYEKLESFMNEVEAELSQEHFHNYDLVGENDIY